MQYYEKHCNLLQTTVDKLSINYKNKMQYINDNNLTISLLDDALKDMCMIKLF